MESRYRSHTRHDGAMASDLDVMRLALGLARTALSTGDVPVGAVVLGPDGSVVGEGRNRREADGDPTAHAEVLALRSAAGALRSEEHTSELQSRPQLVCRLLLE